MKTEYIVLWVDDEVDETDVEDIREFLETYGVFADIRLVEPKSTDDMHDLVKGVVNDPNLDLIIVDNQMFGNTGGMDGNQLIQLIRDSEHVFLPVIFYSSGGVASLMAAVQEQELDGVYLAARDRLVDKAKAVITSLLKKEQTIKRTRGLLMEGVSEIDAKFGNLFRLAWAKLNDEQRGQLIEYFSVKLNEQSKSAARRVESFPTDIEPFYTEMDASFVSEKYTTSVRWKILKKAFEFLGVDATKKDVFVEFHSRQNETPIVTMRNHYGHRTRQQLADGHSEEKCISIRRELRRQYANLGELDDALR